MIVRTADKIRDYGTEKYVVPARKSRRKKFSIRAGDVVRDLGMSGRAPSVCSALKSREFLRRNNLHLVEMTGPKSGQSTTVTYTYEFVSEERPAVHELVRTRPDNSGKTLERPMDPMDPMEAWKELRGSLKDVYAAYGGGEAYLRAERDAFKDWDHRK